MLKIKDGVLFAYMLNALKGLYILYNDIRVRDDSPGNGNLPGRKLA